MTDGRPKTDPPTEAHDSNQLGGEEPPFYAAAAAVDALEVDLSDHAGSTSGVHGVPDTDTVAGQSDVDSVTSDLNDHAGSTSGVHGVGNSNVESEAGAQSRVDDHEAKSNPHSSSASDTDLSNHVNDGTNPHGVTAEQTGALDASDYNPESDTHDKPSNQNIRDAVRVQVASGTVSMSVQTVHWVVKDNGEVSIVPYSTGSFAMVYAGSTGKHFEVSIAGGSNGDWKYIVWEVKS